MKFYRSSRIIEPEWLDHAPPSEAAASLRDLVRINNVFGGHKVLRLLLARVARREEPFTLLDVGAASGDTARVVNSHYARARVTSLDYRGVHLRNAPPPRVCADAFALPFAGRAFDYVFCSLFLHHFGNEQIVGLLRAFAAVAAKCVLVSDLERHPLAYYALPMTRAVFRWDRITMHDGPVSVQAALTAGELRALALEAGLRDVDVRTHRPAFRLSMIGRTSTG